VKETDGPQGLKSAFFSVGAVSSYKVNWQTVLFVGYGDDRVILPSNDLAKTGRTLFLKVSYAYQR